MRVGIGLGANLGDRLTNLRQAISELLLLADPSQPFLVAPFIETAPVDCAPGSPSFLNSAIEMSFAGSPNTLLREIQRIETAQGRASVRPKNTPRPVDLDILYFGNLVVNELDLQIPHPKIPERAFVLEPLLAICPNRFLAPWDMTIASLYDKLLSNHNK